MTDFKDQSIKVGIRKEEFDTLLTEYGKEAKSLRQNEFLESTDVDLDEDFVIISANLTERTVQ